MKIPYRPVANVSRLVRGFGLVVVGSVVGGTTLGFLIANSLVKISK